MQIYRQPWEIEGSDNQVEGASKLKSVSSLMKFDNVQVEKSNSDKSENRGKC